MKNWFSSKTSFLTRLYVRSLIQYLTKNSKNNPWQLSKIEKKSNEVYASAGSIETWRCNHTIDYALTVHIPGISGTIGESTTHFSPQGGIIQKVVAETTERARAIENPAYEFCPPYSLPAIDNPIYDSELACDPREYLQQTSEDLLGLTPNDLHGCRVCSFEIFAETYLKTLVNHKGLELSLPSTKIIWDYVIESPDAHYEINSLITRRFAKHLPMKSILIDESRALLDLQEARLPPTGTFSVVLCDEALDTVFDFFKAQADGFALYYEYSILEKEKSIYGTQPALADTLTLSSDPFLEGGLNSHLFDYLGFPMQKINLITNGKLVNYAIDGKLSALLNLPRTSAMSNVIVKPGATSYKNWEQNGMIEIHRFSTFTPNPVSGAFSGEIRLGYLHKNGQKIPLRGGSISGVSQTAFRNVFFSSETERRGSYEGPARIFFEQLTVSGE